MTIKDNPIDPSLLDCNEMCCLFRWNKCRTKNVDGTCDKPDMYDAGEEFYPEKDDER